MWSQLASQRSIASIDRGALLEWGHSPRLSILAFSASEVISERLVVWCAWPRPECQLSWMFGTSGIASEEKVRAVVHGSSLPSSWISFGACWKPVGGSTASILGSSTCTQVFSSLSFIMLCKELVTPMMACSCRAPLKHSSEHLSPAPEPSTLALDFKLSL